MTEFTHTDFMHTAPTTILTAEQRRAIIVGDRNADIYKGEKGPNGKYFEGGTQWPMMAVAAHAVLLLETAPNEFSVVLGKRGKAMRRTDQWSLLGGYMEVGAAESAIMAAIREAAEESQNIVQLKPEDGQQISVYLDYLDYFNKASCTLGYLFVVRGEAAKELTTKLLAMPEHDEVKEFKLFALDDNLPVAVHAAGGFAYPHELRSILMGQDRLTEVLQLEKTAALEAELAALKKQMASHPNPFNYSSKPAPKAG